MAFNLNIAIEGKISKTCNTIYNSWYTNYV